MIDANKLLRAVVAVGACYAVAYAAGPVTALTTFLWWALLALALLAFYVVLAL